MGLKSWYGRYKTALLQGFLAVAAAAVIFAALPRERQFRYEYKQGAPWLNADLLAPFDFSLYKTEVELAEEYAEVASSAPTIFTVDSARLADGARQVREQLHRSLRLVRAQRLADVPPGADSTLDAVAAAFRKYLAAGVFDTAFSAAHAERPVMVVRQNVASEHLAKDLPSRKSGALRLRALAQQAAGGAAWGETTARLVHQRYTNVYTLEYDSALTMTNLRRMIADVSLTHGLIQEGQRIVSRGEVISDREFVVLESLRTEYKNRGRRDSVRLGLLVGQALMSLVAATLLVAFMVYFRHETLLYKRKIICAIFLSIVGIAVAYFSSKSESIDSRLIPYAIIPIILRVFFDIRFAVYLYSALLLIMGMITPNAYEFILVQYVAGVVAVFSLTSMYRRSQIFMTAANVFVAYSVLHVAMSLMQEGDFTKIDAAAFAWYGGNSLLILWSYPLIYLFERAFGFLSDVSLVEISDSNSPLLRELNEKAPGTFQHSLQVANLAEEAIRHIGGNPLLVRAGALYHDIGKMEAPYFFVENQLDDYTPHSKLAYEKSAEIIIAHVTRGVEIARRHKLPAQVVEFIRSHHGDSLVQYFYRCYKREHPDEAVDVSRFQYPGPLPASKETAVLMLADSAEAASRSLREYTEESIGQLVDNIVGGVAAGKQLRNSNLTFRDIETVKWIFKNKLCNVYHSRIEYPKEDPEAPADTTEAPAAEAEPRG